MKRNPVYEFNNLASPGIIKVPLNSMIHITDTDNTEPGFQPVVIQIIDKINVDSSTTIAQFLTMTGNYVIPSDTTEIPSELQKVQEGGNIGWRLLGADPKLSGDIGQRAIDFSTSTKKNGTTGALGENSFAIGEENTAEGKNSFTAGIGNTAQENQTVIGMFNRTEFTDQAVFIVGAGTVSKPANVLEINKDGSIKAPLAYDAPHSPEDLITRKYIDKIKDSYINKAGDTMIGLLEADEGISSKKNIQALGVLRTGESAPGEPAIEFFESISLDHSRRIYFDRFNKTELKVDVSVAKEGYKIWHEGNDGATSGLDADTLQTFTPESLPLSDIAQVALNSKFEISGGLITGDVNVQTTLKTKKLIAPSIIGDVTFTDDVTFGTIDAQKITSKNIYNDNITLSLDGKVNFINGNVPSTPTSFYWDTGADDFKVDTRTSSETVWHSGNFIKNDYLKLDGGIMTGDLQIDTNLTVKGDAAFDNVSAVAFSATSLTTDYLNAPGQSDLNKLIVGGDIKFNGDIVADAKFTQDVTIDGTLNVPNYFYGNHMNVSSDLVVGGTIVATGSIQAGGFMSLTPDGTNSTAVKFDKDITSQVTSAIKWNITTKEFQVDTNGPLNSGNTDLTLWHAGNFIPDDKVTKAGDTMTGDLQIDTNLTVLGTTTQKETLIEDNLTVQMDATFEGDTSITKIVSDTEVSGETTFTGNVEADVLNVSGLSINSGSEITFMVGTNTGSLIKWDTNDGTFKVLADGNPQIPAEHYELWHAGNFAKADYLDKASYDSNGNGMIDNADKINNLTVETSVPQGALFTDTVYDDTNILLDIQTNVADIAALDAKNDHNTRSIDRNEVAIQDNTTTIGLHNVHIVNMLTDIADNAVAGDSKEPKLGSPSANDMFLTSKTDGTRSWSDTLATSGDITTTGVISAGDIVATEISATAGITTTLLTVRDPSNTDYGIITYQHGTSPLDDELRLEYADNTTEALFTLRTLNKYAITDITSSNHIMTHDDAISFGAGDMVKTVYDTNNTGVVDDAELVNGLTVETAVPANAIFAPIMQNIPQIAGGSANVTDNENAINSILAALVTAGLMAP